MCSIEFSSRIATVFHVIPEHIRSCFGMIRLRQLPMVMLEARCMIRVYFFILITFFPSALMADMSNVRLNTLINICTTAQKSSDLGTIRNVANQLKDAKRPDDIILGEQYDECLLIAYGEPTSSVNIEALSKKINETAKQLDADCRSLLNASPEIAISNPICRDLLIK